MGFRLLEVVEATGGELLGGGPDRELTRLVTDSRNVVPGAMFVALRGETSDGHQHLEDAVAAGASAVMVEARATDPSTQHGVPSVVVPDTRLALRDFTRQRLRGVGCRVVAVTGSTGKTTTKEMIAAIAARRFSVLKTEGNLNTYTGIPMTVAGLSADDEVFVAEYGMSAFGEIAFLCDMAPPDIAVVLNVGLAHAGLLGGIEGVARAKRELVEGLAAGGTAVLNADDPRVRAMAAAAPGEVLFFSTASEPSATVRAEGIALDGLAGSTFDLVTPGGDARVRLPIPGTHVVSDAVAAAAVGIVLGIPVDDIASALESPEVPAGRLKIRSGRGGSTIIDDAYNASPASVEAALAVLLAEESKPRIAILGDMLELGDAAPAAHRGVGRAAAGLDFLVAVGEFASDLAEGAREAGMPTGRIVTCSSPEDAVAAISDHLAGAVILVKASRGVALDRAVELLLERP